MARPAFGLGGAPGFFGHDSLLFVSDEADGHAQSGRGDGLATAAGWATSGHAYGLDAAPTAPEGAPVAPELPDAAGDHGGPDILVGNLIEIVDPFLMSAKGGSPGKPTNGGSADGGGGGSAGNVLDDYFAGSADGTDGFDIWIDFKGSWTEALQQAFIDAADYFVTVITADIGGGGAYRGKVIDDLYITAELKAIDGSGGILGQAGPTAIWTATELTAVGVMQFDVADAQDFFNDGLWDEIVTHEMLHVLGFGTLWDWGSHNLVDDNYDYTGTAANTAFDGVLKVEQDGGSGTAGGHWDEATYGSELMTGWLNASGNYLSEWSVMVLADLGYTVDYQDYPYDNDALIA